MRVLLVVTGLLFAAPAPAAAEGSRIMTVGDLLELCEEDPPGFGQGLCVGYVAGVHAGAVEALSGVAWILYSGPGFCGPEGVVVSYGEYADIFVRWAKANPESARLKASIGVMRSLADEWPC